MHVVIIGNGIAGVTAARWIRKLSDHHVTIVSAESEHFFSRTALMYVYMGHMEWQHIKPYEDWFWEKNRLNLVHGYVSEIDTNSKQLHFAADERTGCSVREPLEYDKLIVACGSVPNRFGWPGQDLKNVSGLYHKQDLEAMEAAGNKLNRAVIVGGGLIGIEMAEMFASRGIPVTMLVRESAYWNNVLPAEESEMVSRHIKSHHIDLRLSTELDSIIDDGSGAVGAVVTKDGETIDCQYVGLTAGVRPNIAWMKESGIDTDRGILVDSYLQTSAKDVYALGDCAQLSEPKQGRRSIEAVWYTGRMMGETVAHTICKKPTEYDPGIWFNSAKFMDIEYQIYGDVPTRLPDEFDTIYYEDKKGNRSIRLVWEKATGIIKGFNLMGVRFRHEVCEKWLADETRIQDVLPKLKLANFDPEFQSMIEQNLIDAFNRKTGQNIQLKSKRKLADVLSFLKS